MAWHQPVQFGIGTYSTMYMGMLYVCYSIPITSVCCNHIARIERANTMLALCEDHAGCLAVTSCSRCKDSWVAGWRRRTMRQRGRAGRWRGSGGCGCCRLRRRTARARQPCKPSWTSSNNAATPCSETQTWHPGQLVDVHADAP